MNVRIWTFAVSIAMSSSAFAQNPAEMRAELDRLEANPPAGINLGVLTSIRYQLVVADRIRNNFSGEATQWEARARAFLAEAKDGTDPYVAHGRGNILNRGYGSPMTNNLQGYAIYLPEDYDPNRRYPLLISLHGGSSNGNLFLGVVLGNNMDWETYSQHLWEEFHPQVQAPMIVVAPDGYGHAMYRWMAEQDILNVIADVERFYSVDPDQVILSGLSNGGVGTYAIGSRHSWRFAKVIAMAGAPSWLQYAGGSPLPAERTAMEAVSGLHLVQNTLNTDFRYFHGNADTGPMRPHFVDEYQARRRELGLPDNSTIYSLGHDILYRVTQRGTAFAEWATARRNRHPTDVHVVTGDYRASRQHWLAVTRIEEYPHLAHLHGSVASDVLTIDVVDNVLAFAIHVPDVPLHSDEVTIRVGEAQVFRGPRAHLGHVLNIRRDGSTWSTGFPIDPENGIVKRPGLSGPITDAYFDRMVHVYGTQIAANTETLRRAAQVGSRGWPVWLWHFEQDVVADTDVTPELAHSTTLVLYGTENDNAVLNAIADRLPIRVQGGVLRAGERAFEGNDVGVRYIYPNPDAPNRYVIVQTGISTSAVTAGHNLPDFLPDYLIYNRTTTRSRPRLMTGANRPLALGYFDRLWQLPSIEEEGDPDAGVLDASVSDGGVDAGTLPIPRAPANPEMPSSFLAPESDPAGAAAREIARRAHSFYNFRGAIPGAQWRVDETAVWQIRPQLECMQALAALNVSAQLSTHTFTTPIPTALDLTGPIDGVHFRSAHPDRPVTISCELATRLPAFVEILKRYNIQEVAIVSAYRTGPRTSFHTFGMALDIGGFRTDRGWLSVVNHYEETPLQRTCLRRPAPGRSSAAILRNLACDVHNSNLFQSVLTPNYNEGHRDHFHIDIRPNDPRLFVR